MQRIEVREALASAVHDAFLRGVWPSDCPVVQRLERMLVRLG
jgi:hypothetical protein